MFWQVCYVRALQERHLALVISVCVIFGPAGADRVRHRL